MTTRLLIRLLLILPLAACGCSAQHPDPIEKVNRKIYSLNDFVDRAVVKDVAMGYEKHVPIKVRDSVDNFFTNMAYLNVILNDHLQGRFAQGWRDTERMAINSTIGVLGVFDPATGFGRPHNRNDFGITLGKWGVAQGPYLMLPILGPSSTRDLPAIVVARVTNPMFWLNPPWYVSVPMDVVSFTDQRARLQPQVEFRDRAALDPYTFTRDLYLRYRAARVGGAAVPTDQDMYDEGYEPGAGTSDDGGAQAEAAPTTAPSATDYMR